MSEAKGGTYKELAVSKKDQAAQTPSQMLGLLKALYRVRTFFDPCPKDPTFDGLEVGWKTHNYVNPPFSQASAWASKAIQEAKKGHHTIMLVPLRPATKYTHELILPSVKSTVIWLNPIRFIPYKDAFHAPIVTYEFGSRSQLQKIDEVTYYPIEMYRWTLQNRKSDENNDLYKDVVLPRLRKVFGSFGVEAHCSIDNDCKTKLGVALQNLSPSGIDLICVMNGPGEALDAIVRHCELHPNSTVAAMVIPGFCTTYMRRAAPFIRKVIFISPTLNFGGKGKSFLGSIILILGKDVDIQCDNEWVVDGKSYLACWKKGEVIG